MSIGGPRRWASGHVAQLKREGGFGDEDQIDAVSAVPPVSETTGQLAGCPPQAPPLLWSHPVLGGPRRASPQPDLDNHQELSSVGDEIDLQSAHPEIAAQDPEAGQLQVGRRNRLGQAASFGRVEP